MNAIRHGLLSKRIAPLGSSSELRDYESQLEGLTAEFAPETQTEQNLVELLARDWARLARIGSYIETVTDTGLTPPAPPTTESHRPQAQLRTLQQLAAAAESGGDLLLDRADVLWLSTYLAKTAKAIKGKDLRSFRAQAAAAGISPAHPSDNSGYTTGKAVTPRRLRMHDPNVVAAVLADVQHVPDIHRSLWLQLFKLASVRKQAELNWARGEEQRHEREWRRYQKPVIARIGELQLLYEYENQCRRSVERTTGLLVEYSRRRLAVSGSFMESAVGQR